MSVYLTMEEIKEICDPLSQPAAQIRHLERMGLKVLRKASGHPLVARAEYERVAVRNADAEPQPDRSATQPDTAGFLKLVRSKVKGHGAQA